MAADKKTLLRDALKQVQAGKIDRAIETYKAIIKVDPRDPAVRNSLGDLYSKQQRKKEAIAEYTEASSLYEKDGFGLRSIAICQKILNLDSEQWAVRLKLADLYARQKLPAEARAVYLQVAERHERRGEISPALEISRKIADLEPDNLPARVKLAEMFEKQNLPNKAAEEYARAAKLHAARKEGDAAMQLFARAFKLFPANLEARRWLADQHARRQDWPVVVSLLETPVAGGLQDADVLVLYAEALTRLNHPLDAVAVLEKAQEREPNAVPVNLALGRAHLKAGDVEKGTAALNRCVSAHLAENRLEIAESLLREMAAAAPEDDRVLQRILEVVQKRGDAVAIGAVYATLAEVYEKKGLLRNAVGALEKLLEMTPGDAAALGRLDELKAAVAPKGEAPLAAPPAAERAPAPTPAALPAPIPAEPSSAEEEVVAGDLEGEDLSEVISEGEDEFVLEIEDEGAEVAPAEPASVAEARECTARGAPERAAAFLEEHLGGDPGDVEAWEALVEARRAFGSPKAARDALLRLADLHRRSQRLEEARAAYQSALSLDPKSAAAADGLAGLLLQEAAAESPAVEASPAAPEELIELSLEEEPAAPSPEQEVLELSPEEEPSAPAPQAAPSPEQEVIELSREEEPSGPAPQAAPSPEQEFLELSLEEEPVPPEMVPQVPAEPEAAAEEYGEIPLPEEKPSPSLASAETPTDEIALPGTGAESGEFRETLAEAGFYFQQGLYEEAQALYARLAELVPGDPVISERLRTLEELRGPAAGPPLVGTAELQSFPGWTASDIAGLDAQLDAALEGEGPAPSALSSGVEGGAGLEPEAPTAPPPPSAEQEALHAVFQEFQRSVKEQLGDEDFETHYNLGIAYKEMGLTDEAIGEFALAEKGPALRRNAVSMIALCLRETGRLDEAVQKLRNGIALAAEGSEDQKGFLYDLADVHEQAGRVEEARETLRQIIAIDPGYRDAAARAGADAPPPEGRRKKSRVSYL